MSARYYWDWTAPAPDDAMALYGAFWDDCPRHAGVGCAPLIAGSLNASTDVRVYFAATTTDAHRIAARMDRHYGTTGVLTRQDDEHLARMHAQYRRKTRGWR